MADGPQPTNTLRGCIVVVFLAAVIGIVGAGVVAMFFMGDAAREGSDASSPAAGRADPSAPSPAALPAGSAVARIRDRGALLVGMDTGEPPWSGTPPMFYLGPDGGYDGFDSEVARQVAAAAGVRDVKIVHAKYSGLEDLLLDPSGKVDVVISGYAPTDTPGLMWSAPYLDYGLALIVPSGSRIKTTADLFGKRIGIFDDDAAAEEVQRMVKGYTELVRMEDGYWDALVNGRFDAFLYDYPYASAELRNWTTQNPSRKGSVRIAQYNLTDSHYAVGMRSADSDLLEATNGALERWMGSPAYGEAIRKDLKGGDPVDVADRNARVVVVKAGDTVSLIAQRELGDVSRWPALWEKNRARFPNPHLIDVGDKVELP
jgi:polar amino acid transport system substrate-binding protein